MRTRGSFATDEDCARRKSVQYVQVLFRGVRADPDPIVGPYEKLPVRGCPQGVERVPVPDKAIVVVGFCLDSGGDGVQSSGRILRSSGYRGGEVSRDIAGPSSNRGCALKCLVRFATTYERVLTCGLVILPSCYRGARAGLVPDAASNCSEAAAYLVVSRRVPSGHPLRH